MTREEAIKVLNTYDVNFDEYTAEEIADSIDMAIEALQTDLVLCKDCKKRGVFGEKGFCELYARGVPDEHYCSYGERREE